MGELSKPEGTSVLNPGYKSQFGGVLGTMSNALGGLGNRVAYEKGFKKPYETADGQMTWNPDQRKNIPIERAIAVEQSGTVSPQNQINDGPWNKPGQEPEWAKTLPTENNLNDFIPARATAYNGLDDIYGSKTAKPNSKTGKFQAIEGVTIAVDPAKIPFGSMVRVVNSKGEPILHGGNTTGIYEAQDTGSAVKKMVASKGKKNVIDFYTKGKPIEANKSIGQDIYYQIIKQG